MSERRPGMPKDGFEVGTLELGSPGPIAFSPDGVLFLADNVRAEIVAIDLSGDDQQAGIAGVEFLGERLAAFLGCGSDDVAVRDLAMHPASQALYLSVLRRGPGGDLPLVVRIGGEGKLSEVEFTGVSYARVPIDDAPAPDDERADMRALADGDAEGEPLDVPQLGYTVWVARDRLRSTTVTDLAYVNGELLVAGSSNEEFASTFRRIPLPFGTQPQTAKLEIFHVVHGRYETHSPIRTFIPYADGSSVLASYTCTPVVHFPLSDLTGGTRAVGRTVADLGMTSTPIDMVSFTQGGEEYVLISNTRRPLMKIACRDVDRQEPLTNPREPVGVPRQELPHEGVSRMVAAQGRVLMLQRDPAGLHLRSYASTSL